MYRNNTIHCILMFHILEIRYNFYRTHTIPNGSVSSLINIATSIHEKNYRLPMNLGDQSNKCMHSCVTKSISIDIMKFIVI